MSISQREFGNLPGHGQTILYTMTNASGASVSVLDYAGTIQSIVVPDKNGKLADVALSCDTLNEEHPGMGLNGTMLGRYANRIAGGTFSIGDQTYNLDCNERGVNHIHGGRNGFNNKVFSVTPKEGTGSDSLILKLHSPDGEEGYPGNLDVRITISFDDNNALTLLYEAVSDKDTILNLSNHVYFNLAGHDSGLATDHLVRIDADAYTPTDAHSIPTGEMRSVEGTLFDLRSFKKLGDCYDRMASEEQLVKSNGFDHNFVLNKKAHGIQKGAELFDQGSGRLLEMYTDMPGVQFYTSNFMNGAGKGGARYEKWSGLCLETQHFPDGINHKNFPSPILKARAPYAFTTIFKFRTRQ